MCVGEGLFWSAISLWGLFFENPPPDGCEEREWKRLETAAFRLYSTLGELRRARDPATVVDLVDRMRRASDECHWRLQGLPERGGLLERARLHLETVRRQLARHQREAVLGRA